MIPSVSHLPHHHVQQAPAGGAFVTTKRRTRFFPMVFSIRLASHLFSRNPCTGRGYGTI